jgi:hypothetical protein
LGGVFFWVVIGWVDMVKKYIVSTAINNCRVHPAFMASMHMFAEVEKAELIVIQGRYRNPSSPSETEEGLWWADDVLPYLTETRRQLCPNLCLYADLRTQPTASRPLTGYNVFLGKNSAIIGHPARALECIPTATRIPRILVTTSACTIPNYSKSKAGAKGEAHHVIGALSVTVLDDGTYFLRHVTAERDGSFYDLDTLYTPDGATSGHEALSLTLGDIHVEQADPVVLKATKALVDRVKPKYLILHDVYDGAARNHHDRGMRSRYAKRDKLVEREVEEAAAFLTNVSTWAPHVRIVRSNHDEFLEKFLEDLKPFEDPNHARYFHALWTRSFDHYAEHGSWPNLFEIECRRLGVPESVHFMKRDESLKLKDTEFGFHGDKGVGGSKGTLGQYAGLGVKTVSAHGHVPGIWGGAWRVGVTGKLEMSYNLKPSAWACAHVLQFKSGKKQLVFIFRGQFDAPSKKTKKRAKVAA